MHQTPVTGRHVAFIASTALAAAIERAAARNREHRSDLLRRLIGDALTNAGHLKPGAPLSNLDTRRQAAGGAP